MGLYTANYHIVEVTPPIGAGIHVANDQVGEVFNIDGAVRYLEGSSGSILRGLTLTDADDQGIALDVLLFDESPTTVSGERDLIQIADAELSDKCIGNIVVASGDYADLVTNQVASKGELSIVCKAKDGSTSIFGLIVTRGTPTYTAAGLTLKFHFEQA